MKARVLVELKQSPSCPRIDRQMRRNPYRYLRDMTLTRIENRETGSTSARQVQLELKTCGSYVSAGLDCFAVGFPIRPTRETTVGLFARWIVPDVAPSSRLMTVDSWREVTNARIPNGVSTTPFSFASTSRKNVNSCSVHTVSALGKSHRLARRGSNLSTVNGRPALAHCRCQ